MTEHPDVSQDNVPYPLSFKGDLAEPLSRWLWLIKWLLLIPHYIILIFLGVGLIFSWLISLFAILFTGRYPRPLFDYNIEVLRWAWRISFYGYSTLGTDKYPPFTLKSGDYPADLDVSYPEKLSRGLVLVKWWLLAIPHYLVVAIFSGGWRKYFGGLISLLTIFSAIAVLFTGRYPRSLFSFILNMNRWVYRVSIYLLLMTDRYPPFRLGE